MPLVSHAGQYAYPTTGLVYMQARWYDPATGQFMVMDPQVQNTWQPYAYADDNPLINTDPSGDCSFPVGCANDAAKVLKKAVKTVKKKVVELVIAKPAYGTSDAVIVGGNAAQPSVGATAVNAAVCGAAPEMVTPCAFATGGAIVVAIRKDASSDDSGAAIGIDILAAGPGVSGVAADFAGLLGEGRNAVNVLSWSASTAGTFGGPWAINAANGSR